RADRPRRRLRALLHDPGGGLRPARGGFGMSDWWRLLREVTRLTVRMDRRATVTIAVLTIGQAAVIAAIGISQRRLVDGSAAGETGTVVLAVVLGSVAYAIAGTAGRLRGSVTLSLIGRVRGRFVEGVQRMITTIPTVV